ncbi:MAG: DNA repair protein RadC [Xanthomonadales bacterium]|nr:DNA repair protein RadC [Xanthomonadales bacterium]
MRAATAMNVPTPDTHRASAEPAPGDLDSLSRLLDPALGAGAARSTARAMLDQAGSLRALMDVALQGKAGHGLDPAGVELLRAAHALVGRCLEARILRGAALTSPAETLEFLQHALGHRRREVFQCLFLDTRHRVLHCETLFQGSIDGACVYPRVVAEHALRHNAAAVIVAHNHPSGVSEPSLADQAITRRLKDALALLEIRLLDHFVIGDGEPVSMAARGMV